MVVMCEGDESDHFSHRGAYQLEIMIYNWYHPRVSVWLTVVEEATES